MMKTITETCVARQLNYTKSKAENTEKTVILSVPQKGERILYTVTAYVQLATGGNKMSDFVRLKMLQNELILALDERLTRTSDYMSKKEKGIWPDRAKPKFYNTEKIHRLIYEIQDILSRIDLYIHIPQSIDGFELWMV